MKLILSTGEELNVISFLENKDLNSGLWILTIEAKGYITTEIFDKNIQDNSFLAILKDDNENEKDLSVYELIDGVRITYGNSFNDSMLRVRLQSKEE